VVKRSWSVFPVFKELSTLLIAALESSTGNVLFGGIDYARFHGDLTVLPLQRDASGGISSFTVVLDNMNIVGAASAVQYTANLTIPVILDSGTTLTYLPDNIATAIAKGVGAVSNVNYGVVVPCELANTAGVFNFQFGNKNGPIIAANISQFVLPFPSDIPSPKFKSGKTACRWGILPADGNPNLFGDTFLRSAYVVYNIDGNQVGIAQTNFNVTTQDIREITATSSLPGASGTASGAARQTFGGGPIFLTAAGATSASASASVDAQSTGTFNLGSPTKKPSSSGSSSNSKKGDAAGLMSPPRPFTIAIAGGLTVLFTLIGGSMFVFV
jgi:hypothetical protein